MDKIWLWFFYSCKRQLKHPFFLLLLILLPTGLFFFSSTEKKDDAGIAIALYSPEQGLPTKIMENLVNKEGTFDFYIAESEGDLINDVEGRRAECGYIFYEGFREKLDSEKYKRSIGLVSAPSTVVDKLSTEVVFASVMEIYGKDLLYRYIQESEVFQNISPEEAWQDLGPLYDQYLNNGSTFSFSYTTEGERVEKEVTGAGLTASFPVRGMVAVYIFVISLFSAVMLCDDEKKGLFIPVPYPTRIGCKFSLAVGPVFLSALSGLGAIWITGNGRNPIYEISLMSLYVILVTLGALVLKKLVRQPMILCSLIPFLTIGSLLVCPVFVDLSSFVPVIQIVRLFFLPYYYLGAENIFF